MGMSLLVVILNFLACELFFFITYLESAHTNSEETESAFFKITIMKWINICFIILMINFNTEKLESADSILQASQSESFFTKFGIL